MPRPIYFPSGDAFRFREPELPTRLGGLDLPPLNNEMANYGQQVQINPGYQGSAITGLPRVGPQVQINPGNVASQPYFPPPSTGYRTPLPNSAPQRPENALLRYGSSVLGKTPVGGALNFTQALARGRVMTDTPIGRLLQSLGHLFGGSLGRHAPVTLTGQGGTGGFGYAASGGREGTTGQQYGTDPYTGAPIMNASPVLPGDPNYLATPRHGIGGGAGGGGVAEGGGAGGAPSWAGTGAYGYGALQGMPGGRIQQFLLNRLS